MTETELKPCPFCGGKAKYFAKTYYEIGVKRGWEFGICCVKCDVSLPKTNYKIEITFDENGEIQTTTDERKLAAEAWNRRAENDR